MFALHSLLFLPFSKQIKKQNLKIKIKKEVLINKILFSFIPFYLNLISKIEKKID